MAREFTGILIAKCKSGHVTRYNVGLSFYRTGECSKQVKVECGTEGCSAKFWRQQLPALLGKTIKEKVCNGKCMSATSDACDCSCGGMNHGGAHPMVSA